MGFKDIKIEFVSKTLQFRTYLFYGNCQKVVRQKVTEEVSLNLTLKNVLLKNSPFKLKIEMSFERRKKVSPF